MNIGFMVVDAIYKYFKPEKGKTDVEIALESKKKKADSYAEAMIQMENEKDPVKRTKMTARLNAGIYDFSDL